VFHILTIYKKNVYEDHIYILDDFSALRRYFTGYVTLNFMTLTRKTN